MRETDATWKFVLVYLVWLVAAVGVSLALALLLGQLVTFLGVESASLFRRHVIEIATVVFFVILAVMPFVIPRLSKNDDRSEE